MSLIKVQPHAHQAKILKYPLNGNSIFFIVQKFIFIVLGKNVFPKLIVMGYHQHFGKKPR
ncbi:hypothetical protein CN450_15540 [Bacillus cereus]|nr:hypothetical protein CN450_15540 [Bacillus cereus]